MYQETEKRFETLRDMVFLPLSYFAMVGTGMIAIMRFISPGGSNGIAEALICALIVANLFASFGKMGVGRSGTNLVALLGIFFVSGLYLYPEQELGIYWLVMYPVVAVLFLGVVRGILYTGLLVASVLPFLVGLAKAHAGLNTLDYLEITLAIIVICLLVVFYEHLLSKYINESSDNNLRISGVAQNLKKEVVQRKRAESQMAEVLKKLEENNVELTQARAIDEATISSIGEAVLIVNQQGVIIRANPSSGRVLGVNQEDLLNQRIEKGLRFALHGKEDKELSDGEVAIARSMEHRSIIEETYQITRPNDTSFYAQMTASPLVIEGAVHGAVVVVRDVTEEVTSDRAKGEFVSIASHQLRTPLSTINWYLEMVLAGDFGDINDEQREFIQEAADAGKRMGDLINSLLNASRIDVGVVSVEPEMLDVRNLIKSALVDLESMAAKKKIEVKVVVDDSVKEASLDARIMEIIFLNLISNAVKYSPEGNQVDVSATVGEYLEIKVTDSGYGIPEASKGKIFTKMFRAENAIENEPDGNGLGLYIIKSILDTIGGSISFESKQGEGTTFTVLLPKDGMEARGGSKQLSVKPGA